METFNYSSSSVSVGIRFDSRLIIMHKGYKSMILNKSRPFDAERVKFPVLERLDHDKSNRSVSVRYS